jgi:hypothetical protein
MNRNFGVVKVFAKKLGTFSEWANLVKIWEVSLLKIPFLCYLNPGKTTEKKAIWIKFH